jgi:hypothetical protein
MLNKKKQRMKRKQWKIASLLAACSLAVTTGCSDEVVNNEQLTSGNEIAFRVSETRNEPTLRAGVTTAVTLTNFTLSGITGDKSLLDGVVVTRSADGSAWEYAPKAAWPAEGAVVGFYAYSPGNSRNVTAGFKGNQEHTLTYKVQEQPNQQEDFLVAVQEHTVTTGTQDPVQLNFKHALSRVLVNARAAGSLSKIDVTVKSVTFKNLASTGTLALVKDAETEYKTGNPEKAVSTGIPTGSEAFTYATYTQQEIDVANSSFVPAYLIGETSDQHFWDVAAGTKTDYPIDMRGANGIKISNDGTTYTAITGDMSALMVLPQQTTWKTDNGIQPEDGDFYVEIDYAIGADNFTAKKRVKDYWKRSEGSFCFEPGKAYEFNIVIGSSEDGGTNPAGSVEINVNDVADWHTYPEGNDGIDVDRRYEVGDVYDSNGPSGQKRYVAVVDEKGRATKLAYQETIVDVLTDLWQLAQDFCGALNYPELTLEEWETAVKATEEYDRFRKIIDNNQALIALAPGLSALPMISGENFILHTYQGEAQLLFSSPVYWTTDINVDAPDVVVYARALSFQSGTWGKAGPVVYDASDVDRRDVLELSHPLGKVFGIWQVVDI